MVEGGKATAGVFSIIRNRDDALRVMRGAVFAFYLAAVGLTINAWYGSVQDLVPAAACALLASLMWRFRSPAAAFTLLLISIMLFFLTVGMSLETAKVAWFYLAITIVVVFASIRAIEATLKIHGRFSDGGTRH